MTTQTQFQKFLDEFVPQVERKTTELNKVNWELETTGSQEAAGRRAELETELRLMFSDRDTYEQLVTWNNSGDISDPLLARQLDMLIRSFKGNMLPKDMIVEMAERNAALQRKFNRFRATLRGEQVSDNDILEILRNQTDVAYRKEAWEASKQVGAEIAPAARKMVALRNRAARTLGYSDFYQMRMELQELDPTWVLQLFNDLAEASHDAYEAMRHQVEHQLAQRFGVSASELGLWAWRDPFGQEDPLGSPSLDDLLKDRKVVEMTLSLYDSIGLDIRSILLRSDLYERDGKNPHAFCADIDRPGDVRILANVRPSLRWLETMLHEAGHGVYDIGINPELPWLLRTRSHLLTTEAIALLMGRQSKEPKVLRSLLSLDGDHHALLQEAHRSEQRSQLIFSRWVLVMTNFEAALYADPDQDLNQLWWQLVERYQRICPPERPAGAADWAAKIHVVLYPVYYHNYLLGQVFSSQLAAAIRKRSGAIALLGHPKVGEFLQRKVFWPGGSLRWDALVRHATGEELTPLYWAGLTSSDRTIRCSRHGLQIRGMDSEQLVTPDGGNNGRAKHTCTDPQLPA
ncbi:MAG: M2 family metallopeptidase [Anaerolineae bacterium]